jgi:TetR/AcrR family transcriptional regulator
MPKSTFNNLPEEKRQRFLELSIEEFADHDFKNASLSNIVARAGIAKGSVYQYFEDKQDLYFYLLQLAGDEKKRFLANTHPPDPAMNLFEFLRWMIQQGTKFELSNPKLAQVAYRALFSDRPFGDEPFEQLRKSALDYYQSLIQLGISQGVIDPDIDPHLAVFVFSTLLNEFGRYMIERHALDYHALTGESNDAVRQIAAAADQLVDILEHGLAPRSRPQGGPQC